MLIMWWASAGQIDLILANDEDWYLNYLPVAFDKFAKFQQEVAFTVSEALAASGTSPGAQRRDDVQ